MRFYIKIETSIKDRKGLWFLLSHVTEVTLLSVSIVAENGCQYFGATYRSPSGVGQHGKTFDLIAWEVSSFIYFHSKGEKSFFYFYDGKVDMFMFQQLSVRSLGGFIVGYFIDLHQREIQYVEGLESGDFVEGSYSMYPAERDANISIDEKLKYFKTHLDCPGSNESGRISWALWICRFHEFLSKLEENKLAEKAEL